jgi:MoaA/NifB/PqqE/SkfB family radical SAM enzyme
MTMGPIDANSRFSAQAVLSAWGKILSGKAPMLSIEITRECPLTCPGCYAYGENHLGGGTTLRQLSDLHGDALVDGVLQLVDKHKPLHVSLVGGEPLIRHRELGKILPALGRRGLCTIVVTSGVIRIPESWMKIPQLRVTVSVDGLPEHHDVRRKPATYQRILTNIAGCSVNIHWVITRPMLERPGYLEEYVAFWNARPEVNKIWVSLYSPQIGERSPEILSPEERETVARELPALAARYPKFLVTGGMARAFLHPPANPRECLFSKMSVNYSADLETLVEPCIFGGSPDCSQCGCSATSAFHSMREVPVAGPVKVGHFVAASVAIGRLAESLRSHPLVHRRWRARPPKRGEQLVHIR